MFARLALLGFFPFLIYLVYSANHGAIPKLFAFHKSIPYGDALGHFCLAGTFSFLATLCTRARTFHVARLYLPAGVVIVFLIVILEEISQIFIPSRSFSMIDLCADTVGIALGGWLAYPALQLQRKSITDPDS